MLELSFIVKISWEDIWNDIVKPYSFPFLPTGYLSNGKNLDTDRVNRNCMTAHTSFQLSSFQSQNRAKSHKKEQLFSFQFKHDKSFRQDSQCDNFGGGVEEIVLLWHFCTVNSFFGVKMVIARLKTCWTGCYIMDWTWA